MRNGMRNDSDPFGQTFGQTPLVTEDGIMAADRIEDSGGRDAVRFDTGIALADVGIFGVRTNRRDLMLEVGSDLLLIQDGLKGSVVERFEFADGLALSAAQLVGRTLRTPVTDSSNEAAVTLFGGAEADTLSAMGDGATFAFSIFFQRPGGERGAHLVAILAKPVLTEICRYKSRRWQYGDSNSGSANQQTWRAAA